MQLFTLSRSNLFSTNERTNEKRKIRRHRSKTHRYPATFVPLRITRNKLAARNARSDLNRAPTEALLSLGGERSGLRRTRNPIDTNWEYDDSARFRRVSSRRRGGRVLGHGKIHESRDYRLVLRPKCLQGNNGK